MCPLCPPVPDGLLMIQSSDKAMQANSRQRQGTSLMYGREMEASVNIWD